MEFGASPMPETRRQMIERGNLFGVPGIPLDSSQGLRCGRSIGRCSSLPRRCRNPSHGRSDRPARRLPADLDAVARIQAHVPRSLAVGIRRITWRTIVWSRSAKIEWPDFVVARTGGGGESEILNLAVAPACGGCGIGRDCSMKSVAYTWAGDTFLEVRESNRTAREFYKALGFQAIAVRPEYYEPPWKALLS